MIDPALRETDQCACSTRYNASPIFRRLIFVETLFWAVGCAVFWGITAAVTWTTTFDFAFGFVLGQLFVWLLVWGVLSLLIARWYHGKELNHLDDCRRGRVETLHAALRPEEQEMGQAHSEYTHSEAPLSMPGLPRKK